MHGEVFTGALAGVLRFAFRRQVPVFERFDRALRDEAERRSPLTGPTARRAQAHADPREQPVEQMTFR